MRSARLPNIILILADDLGYGDLGCYGAKRVATPHVDRLAREGLRFTSGYSTSATCTPSRYSLLTGEYAWRRQGTGILPGDAALIIEPSRTTLPALLQRAGYMTGSVGKQHLGLGAKTEPIDWNRPVAPGPREVGFGYSFIMAATGDRVPCVFLENQQVVGLDPADPLYVSYKEPYSGEPTGVSHRDSLKLDWSHGHNQAVVNHIGRIGYHSEEVAGTPFALRGYQADIDGGRPDRPDIRHTTNNYDERGRTFMALRGQITRAQPEGGRTIIGSLGDYKELTRFIDDNGWNELHIIARGPVLTHILNGQVMSIVIDDDPEHRRMEGLVGVQVHVGPPMKAEYRDFRLKNILR